MKPGTGKTRLLASDMPALYPEHGARLIPVRGRLQAALSTKMNSAQAAARYPVPRTGLIENAGSEK